MKVHSAKSSTHSLSLPTYRGNGPSRAASSVAAPRAPVAALDPLLRQAAAERQRCRRATPTAPESKVMSPQCWLCTGPASWLGHWTARHKRWVDVKTLKVQPPLRLQYPWGRYVHIIYIFMYIYICNIIKLEISRSNWSRFRNLSEHHNLIINLEHPFIIYRWFSHTDRCPSYRGFPSRGFVHHPTISHHIPPQRTDIAEEPHHPHPAQRAGQTDAAHQTQLAAAGDRAIVRRHGLFKWPGHTKVQVSIFIYNWYQLYNGIFDGNSWKILV